VTKRTKTELSSQIVTILPNNSSGLISPADVRDSFTDTADSVVFWDNSVPSSATETCSPGEMQFGGTATNGTTIYHLYVCVATDTWRRMELTSF
jgi:hypothetical protein